MKAWGGRRAQRLVAVVLASKGTTCHLCGGDGADSADHDPPRSRLVALGVPDPDLLLWLWPAHLSCNVRRKARALDEALRVELRERRRADLGLAPSTSDARLSPSIAARRPRSFEPAIASEGKPPALSPESSRKSPEEVRS